MTDDLTALRAENARLREALEPVMWWYQSDEQEDRPLADIITHVVADLQHDRAVSLQVERLRLAGANLAVCAQKTGGTAGPDAGLMLAIRQWTEVNASVCAARKALGPSHAD